MLQFPRAGQIRQLDQRVRGEMGRLPPIKNGDGEVRSQESELQDASHVALVTVLAISDLFDRADVTSGKLSPPCTRPDDGRDESEIGGAFAVGLVPNHELHLPAAPSELARSRQCNRAVDLLNARRCRVAQGELFEESRPADLNSDSIGMHHDPLDEIHHERALGGVRS